MKWVLKWSIVFSLISCSSDKAPSYEHIISKGNLNENGYSNEYFKFKVLVPKNWFVLNKKEIDRRNKMGKELLSQSIDIADTVENKQAKFLININKYRQEAPEAWQGNAGFQITFVKREYFPNDSDVSFLRKAKSLLALSPLYKNFSEIKEIKLAGQTFQTFTSELHLKGFVVFQQNCILQTKDCFLLIDTSFRGEFVKPELDRIVNSITFN